MSSDSACDASGSTTSSRSSRTSSSAIPDQIDRFRFDAVMRRNGPTAGSDDDAGDGSGDPEGTSDSEGEHAAADGRTDAEPGSVQPEDE